MAARLSQRLRQGFPGFTKAEKAVATYMLANLKQLPFETAVSIAESVGVSQMTVGRFLRALGYNGLNELKDEMRSGLDATPLLVSDRVERIRRNGAKNGKLWENFELEIQSLLGTYELVGAPVWRRAVERLAVSTEVHVAGFQTVAGLAADFAARLDYLRPGARYLDGRNGVFSELFAGGSGERCLVLLEMRRYTKLSHLLARRAVAGGIPLIVICDNHCYWARDYTQDVLAVSTDTVLFWDNQAPFASLINLLLNDLIHRLGESVAERTRVLGALQETFGAFQD